MSPELERLNPAFGELSEELQTEVEKRMEVGAAFFLLMNAREIAGYFEEEKRLQLVELKRIEEERIIKEEREKMAAEEVVKSGVFEAIPNPPKKTLKEMAGQIFEKYFLSPIGRPIYERGGLIGIASFFFYLIIFLAMHESFGLSVLAVGFWLVGLIVIILVGSSRFETNFIGLSAFVFSLVVFAGLCFWKMPVYSGGKYLVVSKGEEILKIIKPNSIILVDSHMMWGANKEYVSSTNTLGRTLVFHDSEDRLWAKLFLILNQEGFREWFKNGGTFDGAWQDLWGKIRKILDQPFESRDKVDIRKIAKDLLETNNNVFSLDCVKVDVIWRHNTLICKKSDCDHPIPEEETIVLNRK